MLDIPIIELLLSSIISLITSLIIWKVKYRDIESHQKSTIEYQGYVDSQLEKLRYELEVEKEKNATQHRIIEHTAKLIAPTIISIRDGSITKLNKVHDDMLNILHPEDYIGGKSRGSFADRVEIADKSYRNFYDFIEKNKSYLTSASKEIQAYRIYLEEPLRFAGLSAKKISNNEEPDDSNSTWEYCKKGLADKEFGELKSTLENKLQELPKDSTKIVE